MYIVYQSRAMQRMIMHSATTYGSSTDSLTAIGTGWYYLSQVLNALMREPKASLEETIRLKGVGESGCCSCKVIAIKIHSLVIFSLILVETTFICIHPNESGMTRWKWEFQAVLWSRVQAAVWQQIHLLCAQTTTAKECYAVVGTGTILLAIDCCFGTRERVAFSSSEVHFIDTGLTVPGVFPMNEEVRVVSCVRKYVKDRWIVPLHCLTGWSGPQRAV